MPTSVEPGRYRYDLELSAPEQGHFGGEFEALPPATEEGVRDWLILQHCPHLRGQSVTVTRFELSPI